MLTCMGAKGYLNRLIVWIVAPFILVAVVVLAVLVWLLYRRRYSHQNLLYMSLPLVVRLLFFVYPIVTNVAFEGFSCYEFVEGSWLISDAAVDCNASEYSSVVAVAWLAIVFHPIGLLILNAMLLFAAAAILSRRPALLSDAISFLITSTPHLWWWELVEMMRRLVLVGLFVLLQRGSITVIAGGVLSGPPPHTDAAAVLGAS